LAEIFEPDKVWSIAFPRLVEDGLHIGHISPAHVSAVLAPGVSDDNWFKLWTPKVPKAKEKLGDDEGLDEGDGTGEEKLGDDEGDEGDCDDGVFSEGDCTDAGEAGHVFSGHHSHGPSRALCRYGLFLFSRRVPRGRMRS
jgi:hypothetical protein